MYHNACLEGIGGVLMQVGYVIAYEFQKIKEREKNYVVYNLEFATIIHALIMWRHYLVDKKFTLITDHISLK